MSEAPLEAWVFNVRSGLCLSEPSAAFSTTRALPRVTGDSTLRNGTNPKSEPVRASKALAQTGDFESRLRNSKPDSGHDIELLEMVVSLVMPQEHAKQLVTSLINHFGSFNAAIAASDEELNAFANIGEATVRALRVIHFAAQRLVRSKVTDRSVIADWGALLDYLSLVISPEKIEQCRVLFLDSRNHLVADELIARGVVNHVLVYPRQVIKRALELHATALILVHNHPSGDPTPSVDDIEMTQRVAQAAETMDIVLHDHIILGEGNSFSFRKEGLLSR